MKNFKQKGITTTIIATVVATTIASIGGLGLVALNTKDIRVNTKDDNNFRQTVTRELTDIKVEQGIITTDLGYIKESMKEVLEISRAQAYPFVDTVALPE